MSCKYCDGKHLPKGQDEQDDMFGVKGNDMVVNIMATGDCYCAGYEPQARHFEINFCPMCGRRLKQRLTPAQENAYKGSPRDSKPNKVYGVVDTPENAVQPVFHIGDKIRYKSTGTIEKISTISYGGRFINGVSSADVELIKES